MMWLLQCVCGGGRLTWHITLNIMNLKVERVGGASRTVAMSKERPFQSLNHRFKYELM